MHAPLALLFIGTVICVALGLAVALAAWHKQIIEFFSRRRK